jgi:hypothetical protein
MADGFNGVDFFNFMSYCESFNFFSDSMKLLVVLVALAFLPVIYGLSCITVNTTGPIPLDQFHLDNLSLDGFKQVFNNFSTAAGEDQCRVLIVINSVDKNMFVRFTNLLKTRKLAIGEVQFSTFIWPDQNEQIQYQNQLEYVCSDTDTCEKQFLFDHVEWLLKLNYTDLLEYSASLLIGEGDTLGKLYDSRDEHNLFFQRYKLH